VPISATTDTAGASDYTTAVASALIERYDDFLQNGLDAGAWLYIPAGTKTGTTMEERRIFNILPETGTVVVKYPFAAQVGTSKPIEIHKYKVADKLRAANRALVEVFDRRDFWNPQYVTSLYGQEGYGSGDNEYSRRLYSVPTAFEEFPSIKLVRCYEGVHDGGDGDAALSVSTADFPVDGFIGFTVYNKTDGSSGTVTDNDETTITATLAGGTDNDWDDDDEYLIQDPSQIPQPFTDYVRTKLGSGGAFQFYAVIPENYMLLLEGRGPLTAFATESGTTELYDENARHVATYAAYCFFDSLASKVMGQSREEYVQIAQQRLAEYLTFAKSTRMPNSCMLKGDTSWMMS